MTDSNDDARLWPASPYDLADAHRCPSCFTVVAQSTCTGCGLVLTDPRAGRLLELGRGMLAAEIERQAVITAIRAAHLPSPAPAPVAELVEAPAPVSVAELVEASSPVAELVEAPAPGPVPSTSSGTGQGSGDAEGTGAARRRRLTVPVLLLIVGVSLVGVAAIFFLTLAWFFTGIAVRAAIIGAITVATIVAASLLRRRELTATAEGIAALGVVLLGLDAWAVRANDLFGTGSSQPAVWAGLSALVVAVLCRIWSRVSGPRVPDLAAAVGIPAGIGLLTGGLLDLPAAQAVTAGLLGAAAGGLVHALPAPWSAARPPRDAVVERLVLAVAGVTALVLAAGVLVFATDGVAEAIWANAAIIVLGVAHAVVLRPRAEMLPGAVALRGVASSVAAASAATIGWQLAARDDAPVLAAFVAPVVAVGVAVGLDRLRTRAPWAIPAAVTAGAAGAVTVLAVISLWAYAGIRDIAGTWSAWQTDAVSSPLADPTSPILAVAAAIVIGVLLFLSPTVDRPILRDVRPVLAAALLLAATSRTAIPLAVVAAGAAMAIVSVVALRRTRARAGWVAAGASSAAVAYVAGTAHVWLWVAAVVIAVALPIAHRAVARVTAGAAVAFAVAPVAVAAVSAFVAPSAISVALGVAVEPASSFALLQWVALAAALCAIALRLDTPSRDAVGVSAVVLTAVSLAAGALPGLEGADAILLEPVLAVPRGVLLLVAFGAIAAARTRTGTATILGSAFLLPAVGAAVAHAALRTVELWSPLTRDPIERWTPIVCTAVVVSTVWAAAAAMGRRTDAATRRTRLAVDVGALVTALVVAWPVRPDDTGILLAIVGLGLAAASVTRGWAGLGAADDGLPVTRAVGAHTVAAPRRLFAWPAFAALTAALWAWVGTAWPQAEVEAYTVAPAVGLLAFGALLLWLRRRIEATIAVGAGLTVGLVATAVVSWGSTEPRAVVVAVIAAAAALALGLTPVRRIVPVSVVGAAVSLLALLIATTGLAWVGAAPAALWLLLPVTVALGASFGLARARTTAPSARAFGLVAPSTTLVLSAGCATILAVDTSSTELAAGVLAVALVLHVAAAALGGIPFTRPLRWTAAAVATLAGAASVTTGIVTEVEYASLPTGLALLAGALLSAVRADRADAPERVVWLVGLVVASAPSLLAEPEPLRVWLVVGATLAASLALVFLPVPDVGRLKIASAIVLTTVAIAMSLRALAGPASALPEFAALVAGTGAVAVAAGIVRVGSRQRDRAPAPAVAGVGAALVIVTVALRLDGMLLPTALCVVAAGAVGVAGALLLGSSRCSGVGAVIALGGALTAALAAGVRFGVVSAASDPGVEPDLWALIALATVCAVVLAAIRASAHRVVWFASAAVLSAALAAFAAAELTLLDEPGAPWRVLFTMAVLSLAGAVGAIGRARFGLVLLVVAATLALVVAVWAVATGVRPIEALTVAPAVAGLVVGARTMRRSSAVRSWPAVGPWLALLTVPSLLHDYLGGTDLWRIVALGVVAVALVVIGAVRRLQAPLVLGSAVLLLHAVAQLWPGISAVYVDFWWLWLGIGGIALIFFAARYEKRMRALRTAFTAVTSLR